MPKNPPALWLLSAIVVSSGMIGGESIPDPAGGALAGHRYRVIISSDVGGSDPDDFQSFVHFLVYADMFDTEGLISSPPGKGRKEDILRVLDAYEIDFARLHRHSKNYPEPAALRALSKQGATDPAPKEGFSSATEGSNWIIQRAKADDPRPLYVLVWGSITDVAQALHDAPEIGKKLRVYYVGSWNTKQDPAARDYVSKQHADIWMIEADTTFRGMYMGGRQTGDLGNVEFVARHVRPHGALGKFFADQKPDIKMGDTPSLLYLMRGNPDDPASGHWGGSFKRTDHGANYWTDKPEAEFQEKDRPGARTVNKWRENFLRDWQSRMERLRSQ